MRDNFVVYPSASEGLNCRECTWGGAAAIAGSNGIVGAMRVGVASQYLHRATAAVAVETFKRIMCV